MKYQPGTIIEVKPYRINNEGLVTLVLINDGYKLELARPQAPLKPEHLERAYLGKNFLDV